MSCKFTVEKKARHILHEKTQRFLRGWCRSEEGVYINKEQGFTFLEHAHMFLHSCLMLRNRWGWGWGGVGMHVHVLRTCTHVLVHRNVLDAMHLVQIKMPVSFLSNMLDATAVMRWGGVG